MQMDEHTPIDEHICSSNCHHDPVSQAKSRVRRNEDAPESMYKCNPCQRPFHPFAPMHDAMMKSGTALMSIYYGEYLL